MYKCLITRVQRKIVCFETLHYHLLHFYVENKGNDYLSATDMTSPVWPTKAVVCWPVSMSQSPQVMSPLKWSMRRVIKRLTVLLPRCYNLRVVDKAAAGQISGVTW